MTPIQSAWEALSNCMRLYAESSANFQRLRAVDADEAIANHDRAFEAKLEAFHRLYDVTSSLPPFSYFGHGDTSLVIQLRNAVHHREHSLFVSWNSMLHRDIGVGDTAGAEFLLASYEWSAQGVSRYYLPLHDFYDRLAYPKVKHSESLRAQWNHELSFSAIASLASVQGYPPAQVYVDVMPVFVSAVRRVHAWMHQAGIAPAGADGNAFATHFSSLGPLNLTRLVFDTRRIPFELVLPTEEDRRRWYQKLRR